MNGVISKKKLTNLILILLLILLSPTAIYSDTNENDWCRESVDLSDIMPPIYKDQNDLGFCYAFSATTLVENYACKQFKTSPCETLSVMDAITQYQVEDPWVLESPMDIYTYNKHGGFSDKLLRILRNNGICNDQMAPYYIFQDNSSAKTNWDLLEIYFNYTRLADINGSCHNYQVIDDVIGQISHVVAFTEDNSSVLDYDRIAGAVIEPNVRKYLKTVLVPDKCTQNRTIYDFEIVKDDNANYPSLKKWGLELKRHIATNLGKETPLLIDVKCGWSEMDICWGAQNHSVIVKGVRQNKETGKCELLILNSKGKEWQDERDGGYVDADSVIEDTYEVMWLE